MAGIERHGMELSRPIYHLKHRARKLSRAESIPLHEALDRVAREEGFGSWSLLAYQASNRPSRETLLSELREGDLLLLGGRPGQGKTLLALDLAASCVESGGNAWMFTLESTRAEVAEYLRRIGRDPETLDGGFAVDTSDRICAQYIADQVAEAPAGSMVIVDYLQLLDQRRQNPPLADQVRLLRFLGREKGLIVVLLSQIDRRFEEGDRGVPGLGDVRLPNPLDLNLLTTTCFVHGGRMRFKRVA